MRIVLQKVSRASVSVEGSQLGSIEQGYVLLCGVIQGDSEANAEALAEKIVKLRLFDGEDGKINDRSILDVGGEILVVSQFTLAGKMEKGNRPDYTNAASPPQAKRLYEFLIASLESKGVKKIEQGQFGAHMQVSLINDGPVTLIIDR